VHALALHAVERRQLLARHGRRCLHKVVEPLFYTRDENGRDASHVEQQVGIPRRARGRAVDAKRLCQSLLTLGGFARIRTREHLLRLASAWDFASIDATFARNFAHLRALHVGTGLARMTGGEARVFT